MTRMNGNQLAAPACLLATGILIGSTANAAKLANSLGIDPISFLTLTVSGACLALAIVTCGLGYRTILNSRTGEYFLISGLLSVALPNTLAFVAISKVGAGFVALAFAFPPIFTYLLALIFRLERFQLLRAGGITLGIVGAIILAGSKVTELGGDPVGITLALAMPIVVALGNIYRTLRWPPGASALSLAPGMLLGATLFLLPYSIYIGNMQDIQFEQREVILLLLFQTIAFSMMYVLYFVLQNIAGVLYLTQIGSVGAIAGAAIAVALFGEVLPSALPLAAILIASGVYLVTQTSSGRTKQ